MSYYQHKRKSTHEVVTCVKRNESVSNHTGSFTGEPVSGISYADTGWMPKEWASEFKREARAGDIEYIVWSYWTPIAWRTAKGWTIPRVSYSTYTGRHQSSLWSLKPYRTRIDYVTVTALNIDPKGGKVYLLRNDGTTIVSKLSYGKYATAHKSIGLYVGKIVFPDFTGAGRLSGFTPATVDIHN